MSIRADARCHSVGLRHPWSWPAFFRWWTRQALGPPTICRTSTLLAAMGRMLRVLRPTWCVAVCSQDYKGACAGPACQATCRAWPSMASASMPHRRMALVLWPATLAVGYSGTDISPHFLCRPMYSIPAPSYQPPDTLLHFTLMPSIF